MKIVEIYESNLYKEDTDFKEDNPELSAEEIEELKDNYYIGDFWIDCDYIYSKGLKIAETVQVGEEIIICRIMSANEPDDLKQQLINFYDNKIDDNFVYLDNGMFCSKEENQKLWNEMINSDIGIAYRGGSGYSYGFHKYNK